MRLLAILSVISFSGTALASFELILGLQTLDSSEVVMSRWDPGSRVSLGRVYLAGVNSSAKMSLDSSAPGTVDFLQDYGADMEIRRYNYSTGIYQGMTRFTMSSDALSDAQWVGSNILTAGRTAAFTGYARLYTPTGNILRSYALPTGTIEAVRALQSSSGHTYILSRQDGTNSLWKYTLTSYAVNSGAIASSLVLLDDASLQDSGLLLVGSELIVGSNTLNVRRKVTVTGGTGLSGNATIGGPQHSTLAYSHGHGDIIHGFGLNGINDTMTISSVRAGQNTPGSYWTMPIGDYNYIYDSVSVIAPEPGTIFALGAGVGVLLRRRSRQRSR